MNCIKFVCCHWNLMIITNSKSHTRHACSNFAFVACPRPDGSLLEMPQFVSMWWYLVLTSSSSTRTLFSSSKRNKFSWSNLSLSRLSGPISFIGLNVVFLVLANFSRCSRWRVNSLRTSLSCARDFCRSASQAYLQWKQKGEESGWNIQM